MLTNIVAKALQIMASTRTYGDTMLAKPGESGEGAFRAMWDFRGLPHIQQGAAVLSGTGDIKERLLEAAAWYWVAMFYRHELPVELQTHSDSVDLDLFSRGTVADTIRSLDRAAARSRADELMSFFDAVLMYAARMG